MSGETPDTTARAPRRALPWRRGLAILTIVLLVLGPSALVVLAAQAYRVTQKGRAFNVKELSIAVGDVVQFGNDDEFIHQVYVENKAFNFDTAESSPGDTIEIKFSVAGTFEVHCHIHPKMGLVVNVK